MRVGSLFAGIGGFDLGLERAGFTIGWQVEIDPWCRRVLEKHWPNVPRYEDIRVLKGAELASVDLVCGGPPCQPVSLAGQRRGEEDDRYLWPEALGIVDELKPAWVLFENPIGFKDLGLDDCLSRLEGLGYEVAVFDIPACAVGAPQERRRLWLVAHNAGARRPRAQRSGVLGPQWTGGFERPVLPAWPLGPNEVSRLPRGPARLSHRMDRLTGLGNAVVPQVVEAIGRAIMEVDHARL